MENKINTSSNSLALKKVLYENPISNFRIKVENSKKNFERAKYEVSGKQSFPSLNKLTAFIK